MILRIRFSRSNTLFRRLSSSFACDSASDNTYICTGFKIDSYSNITSIKKKISADNTTKYTLVSLPKDIKEAILLRVPSKRGQDDVDSLAYLFKNGIIVTWNVSRKEKQQLRLAISKLQTEAVGEKTVEIEKEQITYKYTNEGRTGIYRDNIVLCSKERHEMILEQYAFSHAIALSVRLAIWEQLFDNFISSISWIPNALKNGQKITISRGQILKKTGALLSIRYQVNLTSDLLNPPDYYWDNPKLEDLYNKMLVYLDVKKRGRAITEMMNHCSEIVDLLRTHLNERHSFRLEWGIIILILIEVIFEVLHYINY